MRCTPFLKWVGGKGNIVSNLLPRFPKVIGNYYEPFLGGGSVLISFLQSNIKVTGSVVVSDINENLIRTYIAIREEPDKLVRELGYLKTTLLSLPRKPTTGRNLKPVNIIEAMSNRESYYYWIRRKYNEGKGYLPAAFIFLNKTCFRGLYRCSKNGFNVGYGNYVNPSIYSESNIRELSKLFQGVTFDVGDFSLLLANCQEGDFVYMDPPYVKEESKSFTSYSKEGFDPSDSKRLFQWCRETPSSWLMSNSKSDLVTQELSQYNIEDVVEKRRINSKNPTSTCKAIVVWKS